MNDLTIEEIKTGGVKIRAGYETRILATDLGGSLPVCIAFKGNAGWRVARLTENGKQTTHQYHDHDYDLVPIPQVKYFNVYQRPDGGVFIGKFHDDTDYLLAVRSKRIQGTYKYLNGDITKVEPGEHE